MPHLHTPTQTKSNGLFDHNSKPLGKHGKVTVMCLMIVMMMVCGMENFVYSLPTTSLLGDAINWNNLTQSELNVLDPSVFTSVSAESISSIPSDACAGFRSDQIGSMSEGGCVGFQPDCFSNIPALAFNGLTSVCLLNIQTLTMSRIQYSQLAQIQPDTFSGLTASQLSSISSASCAAFSARQLEKLPSSVMFDSCVGFQKDCFLNISADSFSGFTLCYCRFWFTSTC